MTKINQRFYDIFLTSLFLIISVVLYAQEKTNKISFQMEGSLMGQYNSFEANSSEIPANQFVFRLKPTLTLYNIPLTADIRLVRAEGNDIYSRSMSQINFGFDINKFKKNLMSKALGKVNSIKEKGNLADISDLENFSKENLQKKAIAKLKDKLNQPEAIEALEKLKEIESLETALDNPAFEEKLAEFNSLKSKYKIQSKEDIAKYSDEISLEDQKKIMQLYALEEKKDKLLEKKDKLVSLQKDFEKYRKLADRLDNLENPTISSVLRDPKNLKSFLNKYGGISKVEKMLMVVDHMNFGKSYPYYSAYTVNRIALSGFDVAINPGIFYISALGGKSQFNLFDEQGRLKMYDRQLYGAKVGLGHKNRTHFHLIALKANDDQGNLLQQDSVLVEPKSNLLLGVDLKLSMFKRKFEFSAEAVTSAYNNSDLAPQTDSEIYPSETPDFVRNLFSPNLSTHIGVAYKMNMRANLFSNATRLKAKYEYIGPGYQSMAAPILIRDRLFYNFSWNQYLFNRRFNLSIFHKQEQDNLVPWKAYQTTSNSSGLALSFINKGFTCQANYAPYFQSNDLSDIPDSSKIKNLSHMYSVTSSYNYKIGELAAGSQLSFMKISGEMISNGTTIPSSSISSLNIVYNQSISISKSMQINFNTSFVSYQNSIASSSISVNSSDSTINLFMFDLASSFVLFKKWSNSIGFQYANEDALDNKIGFSYTSSIPVYKKIQFKLTIRQNQYKDPVDLTQNFSALYLTAGLDFKL
tara:strand:- start:127 stop:2382 length:2256 start_codon:yes stop_codon:yes gene_type:complete